MLKSVRKLFSDAINMVSEAIAAIGIITGMLMALIVATIAIGATYLFCHPVGWIILIILVLKHC